MNLRTLLVGEAWGPRELAHKHALVGPTGIELSLMLSQTKFAPALRLWCRKCGKKVQYLKPRCAICGTLLYPQDESMWKTVSPQLIDHWAVLHSEHSIGVSNVFNLHPPHNELGHFFGHEKQVPELIRWKPSRKVGGSWVYAEHFPQIERLWSEIADHRPNVVVALGNAACWALLNQTKISELRGTFHWSKRCEVKVVPTFHPAAVLRNYSDRTTVLADLDKSRRESERKAIVRPERYFTIPYPDERGIKEIEEWFSRQAQAYTSDIETSRGQISIVGFGRNKSDGLVIPFHTDAGDLVPSILRPEGGLPPKHGNSYWPTPQLEFRAWKWVIHGLKTSIRKIGQNWLYDLSYFLREGLIPSAPAVSDTMLRHHSRFPEMRKGLGYLASIYLDEIGWKSLAKPNELKRDE